MTYLKKETKMKKELPLWLVVIQNTKTKKNTYFNEYGYSADEVLTKISDGFFDKNLLSINVNKDKITKKLERSKEVTFPKNEMKVLVVKKCKNIEEFNLIRDKIQNGKENG